jgi:hypothetical protein
LVSGGYQDIQSCKAPNFMKTRSRSPESATQDTPKSRWNRVPQPAEPEKQQQINNSERTALARIDHSLILARRGAGYRLYTETESVY